METVAKPSLAMLSAGQVAIVEQLERDLGGLFVLAYERPLQPATLTPDQIERIRKAERELGTCLVAYNA
jgi:hypothetical protein